MFGCCSTMTANALVYAALRDFARNERHTLC